MIKLKIDENHASCESDGENKYIHQNNIIEKEKSQYAGKDTLEENDES